MLRYMRMRVQASLPGKLVARGVNERRLRARLRCARTQRQDDLLVEGRRLEVEARPSAQQRYLRV